MKKVQFVYTGGSKTVMHMKEENIAELLEKLRSDILYTSVADNNTTVINMRNVLFIEIES